jgi:uncharacterized membrane protein
VKLLAVIRVVAIVTSGLMAGLLFGDWLGPSFARSAMDLSSFVHFQQIIHDNYVRALPFVSPPASMLPLVWLILLRRHRRSAEFRLVAIAALAIAAATAITFLVNIPVNSQLESWAAGNPPSNAREIWAAWETAHVVRTPLWLAGFGLEVVALAVAASTGSFAGQSASSPGGPGAAWYA